MSGEHSFEHCFRVEIALERLGLHETDLAEQWRGCAVRWGSLSTAALDCLLALVREALGVEVFVVRVVRAPDMARGYLGFDGWEVWDCQANNRPVSFGPTEAEALVAALEAAP